VRCPTDRAVFSTAGLKQHDDGFVFLACREAVYRNRADSVLQAIPERARTPAFGGFQPAPPLGNEHCAALTLGPAYETCRGGIRLLAYALVAKLDLPAIGGAPSNSTRFGLRAEQISTDGLFGGDHLHRGDFDFAAIAHGLVLAGVAVILSTFGRRVDLAHEIDYRPARRPPPVSCNTAASTRCHRP